MTIRKMRFTPEVLLGAPRRTSGIPSPTGRQILYSESTYSFEKHEKKSEIRLLDVESSETSLVIDDGTYSNPVWLDLGLVAMLHSVDGDETELVIGTPNVFKKTSYVAGAIPGPADSLKIVKLKSGRWAVAMTAKSNPDGSMYNPSKVPKPHSSAKIYDKLFVRHWDTYITPERNSIFYASLTTSSSNSETGTKKLSLSPLINALKGTTLESPIPPFGGKDHFDISKAGLVFISKDPDLDPALNTKCGIYFLPLTTFSEEDVKLRSPKTPGIDGAFSSPVFSRDGAKVAFLGMATNGYESDQNRILVIEDINHISHITPYTYGQYSPSSVKWGGDDTVLYFTAEQFGSVGLFAFNAGGEGIKIEEVRSLITEGDGSVHDVQLLPNGEDDLGTYERLFLSSASLIESQVYTILEVRLPYPGSHPVTKSTFRVSQGGSAFGLSRAQISKFNSPAADPTIRTTVESWMIKPSRFSSSKKYPLALLIHGGPQGAWNDDWSTRWNPAVFAEQGYVVVAPNITGSTGYTQPFTDAIACQWGGTPYQDLELLFSALEGVSFIDTTRAVALGASYGGYMINYLQGHALGRRFKALVTHDGIYSTHFQSSTDELYFLHHDFGGSPFDPSARPNYERWDPARFVEEWRTPHLVVHSERDYRLSMADGLAAFNALQERGVKSRFLMFEGEGHWVLQPENGRVWHEVVIGWINGFVGLSSGVDGEREDGIGDEIGDRRRRVVVVEEE